VGMLKLPLTVFTLFSLVSSLAAAEVNAPPRDTGTPVADDSQDAPSVVATAGVVAVPDAGGTMAVEARVVDRLYLGAMLTGIQGDEAWVFGGARASYRLDVSHFTVAPFAALVGVWGGRVSNDERGRHAETITVMGGGQLSAHFGPVLVGVEAGVMPLRTTESDSDYAEVKAPDETRWDTLATVAGVAGARF
jgi:hypothetical protein